jgi:mono/diheme cytochrome c family protein
MKAYAFPLALFSCSLLCASAALSAQPPADANLLANPIFQKNCVKCHGKTAEGRHFGGPSLISNKTSAASDDELRNIITHGKGRMPKYATKLTPEEISTLVRQVRALTRK